MYTHSRTHISIIKQLIVFDNLPVCLRKLLDNPYYGTLEMRVRVIDISKEVFHGILALFVYGPIRRIQQPKYT